VERARELLTSMREAGLIIPVVVAVESGEPWDMFELFRLGVVDFITPPFKPIEISPRLWRLLERTRQQTTPAEPEQNKLALGRLIGRSPTFLAQVNKITLGASCDAGILILGETGTGKELFARAIHQLSLGLLNRSSPSTVARSRLTSQENELFGHERGAFTGAARSQPGMIQEADGALFFWMKSPVCICSRR